MQRQDIIWKGLLEDLFADFLELVYPGVWTILDKERGFTFLEKELEQVFPPEDDEFSPKGPSCSVLRHYGSRYAMRKRTTNRCKSF